MASLSDPDLDELHQIVMQELSAHNLVIPASKAQLRTFMDMIDDALNGAEIGLVQSIPAGPNRQWLIDNPPIGRRMLELVLKRRREVL